MLVAYLVDPAHAALLESVVAHRERLAKQQGFSGSALIATEHASRTTTVEFDTSCGRPQDATSETEFRNRSAQTHSASASSPPRTNGSFGRDGVTRESRATDREMDPDQPRTASDHAIPLAGEDEAEHFGSD